MEALWEKLNRLSRGGTRRVAAAPFQPRARRVRNLHGLDEWDMINFLLRRFVRDSDRVEDRRCADGTAFFRAWWGSSSISASSRPRRPPGGSPRRSRSWPDAFNNLSDAGSSVVTLVGFKMACAPSDSEHPFGHGRIEYVSGLAVSMAILLVGSSWRAVRSRRSCAPRRCRSAPCRWPSCSSRSPSSCGCAGSTARSAAGSTPPR